MHMTDLNLPSRLQPRAGAALACALPLALAACGSGGGGNEGGIMDSLGGTGDSMGTDDAGDAGDAGDADGGGKLDLPDQPAVCEPACDDGFTCIDGSCCAAENTCGDTCCGDGDVCSFGACVTPGKTCIDAFECADGEYCEFTLGDDGGGGGGGMCTGGTAPTGKCLPRPPTCAAGEEPDPDDLTCVASCQVVPDGTFQPTLKYDWTGHDVMMAPVVVQLDDDNCDGLVNERDLPDIVFSTFASGAYNDNGTLRAISVDPGTGNFVDKWSINPQSPQIYPGGDIAGGDVIPGSPGNEIAVCNTEGGVTLFHADGQPAWTSPALAGCTMTMIADTDKDGTAEVVTRRGVLDGLTGALEVSLTLPFDPQAVDVDQDGYLEFIAGGVVVNHDGTPLVDSGLSGGHAAAADFDDDGKPEIVTVDSSNHVMHLWRYDASVTGGFEIIRQDIDINGPIDPATVCTNPNSAGATRGGGPPTIADFDGDGTPDFGIAGGVGYAVFSGALLMDSTVADVDTDLWIEQSKDCSSAQTGSSVFDFDGDGQAEVVYADEEKLRIYEGKTGAVRFEACNTSGTLREFPLVADMDADGQADLIVASNSYSSLTCSDGSTKTQGIRVFADSKGQWVRTRRIWNQHGYHITNVNEDGTIPQVEDPHYAGEKTNNFRQNVQPDGEFAAPDLVASITWVCGNASATELGARIRNVGEASAPAGVPVFFYDGDPAAGGQLLEMSATTRSLYPAEAEDVMLTIDLTTIPQIASGEAPLWVVVDESMPTHAWRECRPDNNTASGEVACGSIG